MTRLELYFLRGFLITFYHLVAKLTCLKISPQMCFKENHILLGRLHYLLSTCKMLLQNPLKLSTFCSPTTEDNAGAHIYQIQVQGMAKIQRGTEDRISTRLAAFNNIGYDFKEKQLLVLVLISN